MKRIANEERVSVANKVLACFQNKCKFYLEDGILMMQLEMHNVASASYAPVKFRRDLHWFSGRLSKLYPGGGGSTTAACTLAQWIFDLPRLPLASWEYWAKESGPGLLRSHPEAVEFLREAGYEDAKTACVKCGSSTYAKGIDWWHGSPSTTGPCCMWGSCALDIEDSL